MDSLLSADGSASTSAANFMYDILPEEVQELHVEEPISSGVVRTDPVAQSMYFHSSFICCIVEQTLKKV